MGIVENYTDRFTQYPGANAHYLQDTPPALFVSFQLSKMSRMFFIRIPAKQ